MPRLPSEPRAEYRDLNADRRQLIHALLCAAGAGSSIVAGEAHAAALPLLDPKDPAAVALAYTHAAKSVDRARFPTFDGKQNCANCALLALGTAIRRPCSLFPGKLVMAGGWCRSWVAKKKR
jgi:hypothetical protein